ncbi:MAG: glycerol-3-phosphate dehydrogenase/oxidase [Pirellulales bacterium]|nr:glycerol-3-phosphate dehydrogenase/oxidase [Pirellulales bacterium]
MTPRREAIYGRFATQSYDVLVIGGGITGAGIVRDATLRGLSCALIDKGDFASGTSSKSGKLIHGGLRYLKHLHVRLVFEACRERWWLLTRVAPHLVRPVRFVVPFNKRSRTKRWQMALGLVLYDLLAMFRRSEPFRFLSAAELAATEPALQLADCTGGLSYFDCQALDTRLVIDTLKSAAASGADVLNYAELVSVEHRDGLWRATLRDALDGRVRTVAARTVVNASGPWADEVQARLASGERFNLKITSGVHLVIARERLPVRNTLALEVERDGRMIYVVPWGDYVLVGTTDVYYPGPQDAATVGQAAVAYLLETLQRHFPARQLTRADVAHAFVGLRPLIGSDQGQREEDLPRDDCALVDEQGRVSITGGKLTTYRAMSERVVDLLVCRFFRDRALGPCRTLEPISGGAPRCPGTASPRLRELWSRWGSNAATIEHLIATTPELGKRIDPCAPYLWAEAEYALQHEFVERLDDLVDRRFGAFVLAPEARLREAIGARFNLGTCEQQTDAPAEATP